MTINDARIVLGGSAVDLLEFRETMQHVSARLMARDVPPLAVTSINLDHIHHFGAGSDWTGTLDTIWAQSDNGSGNIEWLNLIDGAPLAAQARRLTGHPWPRLAGSDLIGPILALAEASGARVGFLGGTESTHQQLRSALPLRHPALQVSGYWAPSREDLWDSERSGAIAGEIRDADTDVLVVGLGKPRQELWIAEHGLATGARVLLAFGAVVDFLAGRVSRAPQWVVERGMEWAWRLALEPKRLSSRYLVKGPPAYLAVRRTRETDAAVPLTTGEIFRCSTAAPPEPRFLGPEGHATVAVIIVAEPGRDIRPVLESLHAESHDLPLRVIVVEPGAGARIPDEAAEGLLVAPGDRRGYASALNTGRKHVGDADAVLVLNADNVPERGSLQAMINRMNRARSGAVMPRLLDADMVTCRSIYREPSLRRALFEATPVETHCRDSISDVETDPERYEHAHQVKWGASSCLMVRKDVYDVVGERDERFAAHSAETDFFRRVRDTGATIWYEPGARIRHDACPAAPSPTLAALLTANRLHFNRRHRPLPYAIAFHIAVALRAGLHCADPVQRRILRAALGSTARLAPVALADPLPQAVPLVRRRQAERPAGAVIIPAHDEEAVIARTLRDIAPLAELGHAQVIVVCNGCNDATADIARRFTGVQVAEIVPASKTAALNAGDALAAVWPRLYLDADVEIDPQAVLDVFAALSSGSLLAARPAFHYDTTGASGLVKSYYRARGRIPTTHGALWGAGAYAVNQEGHNRFDSFPDLTADDSYVDAAFAGEEKCILPTTPVTVRTPRDMAGLLAVVTRQHRGNAELAGASTTVDSAKALLASVRGPVTLLDALCYATLAVIARLRSRRNARRPVPWERDCSSRVTPEEYSV